MSRDYKSQDLSGLCTDKTRTLLEAGGWEFDGMFWTDPVSGQFFAETEATAIMLKRLEYVKKPTKGLDKFIEDRDRRNRI